MDHVVVYSPKEYYAEKNFRDLIFIFVIITIMFIMFLFFLFDIFKTIAERIVINLGLRPETTNSITIMIYIAIVVFVYLIYKFRKEIVSSKFLIIMAKSLVSFILLLFLMGIVSGIMRSFTIYYPNFSLFVNLIALILIIILIKKTIWKSKTKQKKKSKRRYKYKRKR